MKIAITGHRPNKLGNEYNQNGPISQWIKNQLIQIVKDKNPTQMISGMALGVDQIWALIAVWYNIPLLAAIPCIGQEKVWPKSSQDTYNNILKYEKCEKIIVSNCTYNSTVMQKRNEFMCDNSDMLICVWDGTKGGTKNCVDYAQKINKEIIRIDPKNFS